MAKDPLRFQYNLADLAKFILLFSLVLALFASAGVGSALDVAWPHSLLMPFTAALAVALTAIRRKPSPTPQCVLCGRRYYPFPKAQPPGQCPACRTSRLPGPLQRRAQRRGLLIIAILVVMLAAVLVWPFSDFIMHRVGGSDWLVLPLVTLGLALVLFAVLFASLVLRQLLNARRVSRPGQALAIARACAGDEGEAHTCGPATVWGFGTKAPVGLLNEQMQVALKRFEAIVGEPVDAERPLDVFVFAKRDAFETFLRRTVFVSSGNHDAMFIPWSTLTIACTTDLPPDRLTDVGTVLRTVFAYYALAAYKGVLIPSWLQIGIAYVVASGGGGEERARLNRKMTAAISRNDTLGAPVLFEPKPRVLASLLRNQADHANFARYNRFVTQSWSVVEFLGGAESSLEEKERFRAFVREIRAKESVEVTFQRHFGHGYNGLLAQWKDWVLAQGLGGVTPPSQRIQDTLVDRVLAVVRDPGAPLPLRVRAVREMGKAGYALGTDALIDVLRRDDPLPKEEIVWALESISGLALGDDIARWERWWNSLVPEVSAQTGAAEACV